MDDRRLYDTILGIAAPWDVARVELDDRAKAVHVWLEERRGTLWACPECQTASPLYDHVERSWRHLDTCQYEARLHAPVPRIECLTQGVKTVPVPWATRAEFPGFSLAEDTPETHLTSSGESNRSVTRGAPGGSAPYFNSSASH